MEDSAMLSRRVFFISVVAGICILAFAASAQQPAAARQIEVIDLGTVHSLPSPMLDVLGSVTPGERFTVYATSGPDWYKIDFHGKVGYIPRVIVKLVPRVVQQPAAPAQIREKAAPQAATADKTATAKTPATKPAAATTAKPKPAVAEKPVEPAVESENTEPVAVVPPIEITEDAETIKVEAESGSNLTMWLIIGGVVFVGLILLLIHFERPDESANDFVHHHPH
jgi:hypothetical protein